MRIVVTGAGGFVGAALAQALLAANRPDLPVTALTLVDAALPSFAGDARLRTLQGDLADPALRAAAFEGGVDCLFHLAAVPGGAAERDQAAGWRVNLDITRALFMDLAALGTIPRVVFTSSIAVFGVPMPAQIDDATLPIPTMTYGAQKLMMEAWLTDASRRGTLDARAVRLPGIVARPEAPTGHISAFLSNVFHQLARGEAFTFPVGAAATTWMMSRACCVDNLLHAAALPADRLPLQRAFTLPALRVSMAEIVDGLAARYGTGVAAGVRYAPVEDVEAQFGRQPPLATPLADSLGFSHDGDVASLIRRVLPAAA